MSILDRLEEIRINERLKKKQFEEIIGKSSGYIGTLQKNNGVPGSDVLIKLSDYYPNKYNLDWILTGEGEMLKSQKGQNEESFARDEGELYPNLRKMQEDLKKDLEILAKGVTKSLQDQQKVLDFIKDLDPKEISRASKGLNEFLQEKE